MINLLGRTWILDWLWLIILGAILIAFIIVVLILVPFKLWFKAFISGCRIGMFKLIGLKLRKLEINEIVETYITARKAGVFIDLDELETHQTAGGHIDLLVKALILAQNFKVDLSIDTAKAIDLSGKSVVDAVKGHINTKVIKTENISCIAGDGIEVKVKFKVTLRPNLVELVGALGEDSIIGKIGENAVGIIGGYKTHQEVLQNAEDISKMLMLKDLDEKNAYKIVSIDVENIEVGKDVGAQMRASKLEEEKLREDIEAQREKNKIMLEEQKMKVKVQELNAEKVKAEIDLPKVLAKSVREGKINIMDYYKMQNIIADTDMRKSFTNFNKDEESKKPNYFVDDDE